MSSQAALKNAISPIDALLRKQEIIDYVRHLATLLDEFRLGEFVDEFTEDGHYRLIPRDNYESGYPVCIIDDNKNRLRYRQRLVEKHWHFQKFRELRVISPVSTVLHSETAATAKSNYVIYVTDGEGRSNLHICGQFEDELRNIGGRWRIKNRRAILDTFLPTYAIVLPP